MPFFENFAVFNASGPHCTTLKSSQKLLTSDADYIVMKILYARTPWRETLNNISHWRRLHQLYVTSESRVWEIYRVFTHTLWEIWKTSDRKYRRDEAWGLPYYCRSFWISMSRESPRNQSLLSECCRKTADCLWFWWLSRSILEEAIRKYKKNTAFGVKLPPYFDFAHYEGMAAVLRDFPIHFITCVNSVGNTLVLDPETHRTVIKPKGGFWGWRCDDQTRCPRECSQILWAPRRQDPNRRMWWYREWNKRLRILSLWSKCYPDRNRVLLRKAMGYLVLIKNEANEYAKKQGWESIEAAKGKLEIL